VTFYGGGVKIHGSAEMRMDRGKGSERLQWRIALDGLTELDFAQKRTVISPNR
jgi:hypothetical protein